MGMYWTMTKLATRLPFVAGIGATIEGAGILITTAKHLPEAILRAYQAVYRTNKIGPNLKGLSYVLIPETGLILVPLTGIAATLFGVGRGCWTFSGSYFRKIGNLDRKGDPTETPWRTTIQKCLDDLKTVNAKMVEFLIDAKEYEPQALKEGETPFDIKIAEGLLALLAGAISCPIDTIGMTLISIRHYPRFVGEILHGIWNDRIEAYFFPLLIVGSGIFLVVSPLVIPLCALIGAVIGLRNGCYICYKDGIRESMKKTFSSLWEINRDIGNAFTENKKA